MLPLIKMLQNQGVFDQGGQAMGGIGGYGTPGFGGPMGANFGPQPRTQFDPRFDVRNDPPPQPRQPTPGLNAQAPYNFQYGGGLGDPGAWYGQGGQAFDLAAALRRLG